MKTGKGQSDSGVDMHQGGRNGNCRSLLTASAHLAHRSLPQSSSFAGGKLHDVSRDGLLIR